MLKFYKLPLATIGSELLASPYLIMHEYVGH